MNLGRVLVVAAHYDDEVLGAGGVLARAGHAGMVTVLCDPWMKDVFQAASKEESLNAVGRIQGHFGTVYQRVGLRDEKLDLREAISVIEGTIGTWDPDTVIGHWRGDMNQDHRVAAQATLIAARATRTRVTRLLAMEVPSSTNVGNEPIGDQGLYVGIEWSAKARMLSEYTHVLTKDRDMDVMKANATMRGSVIGSQAAEFYRVLWERM